MGSNILISNFSHLKFIHTNSEQSTFALTLQMTWNHLRHVSLLLGTHMGQHTLNSPKTCKCSSLWFTLLLTALVEPCSCCICPQSPNYNTALSYSLLCSCKNLRLSAAAVYKATCGMPVAEVEVLLGFATWGKKTFFLVDLPAKATSRQATRIPTLPEASQIKNPLLWLCDILSEKQEIVSWRSPWVRHRQLLRATLAFPLWVPRSPCVGAATSCQPWSWAVCLGAVLPVQKRGLLQLSSLSRSILLSAQVPENSGLSSLWIRRARDLIFFWIPCHQAIKNKLPFSSYLPSSVYVNFASCYCSNGRDGEMLDFLFEKNFLF